MWSVQLKWSTGGDRIFRSMEDDEALCASTYLRDEGKWLVDVPPADTRFLNC